MKEMEQQRKEKLNKAKAFHNEATQWEKETGKLE